MPELWTAYRESPSPVLRQQLIEQYAPLAKYVVDRLNIQTSSGISYDDLLGQAIIGLIEAIDRFDPARGVKFSTFAYYRIRGAVMDMLRDLDWVPRSLRARSNEIITTIAKLEEALGRPPTDAEVAGAMGITEAHLDEIAQEVGGATLLSLDEMSTPGGGDAAQAMVDQLPDHQAVLPENKLEEEDSKRVLAEAIDNLPTNERHVISLYYYEGLTLKEIGKVLGVTESRACQIHSKAILRLRGAMHAAFSL